LLASKHAGNFLDTFITPASKQFYEAMLPTLIQLQASKNETLPLEMLTWLAAYTEDTARMVSKILQGCDWQESQESDASFVQECQLAFELCLCHEYQFPTALLQRREQTFIRRVL
jgi:hypothetical protein